MYRWKRTNKEHAKVHQQKSHNSSHFSTVIGHFGVNLKICCSEEDRAILRLEQQFTHRDMNEKATRECLNVRQSSMLVISNAPTLRSCNEPRVGWYQKSPLNFLNEQQLIKQESPGLSLLWTHLFTFSMSFKNRAPFKTAISRFTKNIFLII